MDSILKWTESKIEQFDSIASKALNFSTETQPISNDSEIIKLRDEIKTIKSVTSTQLKDLQEKLFQELDSQKSEIASSKTELKSLTEENNILKENLRNADSKLNRLAKVNEELSSKLETNEPEDLISCEDSEYQTNLLSEKLKRLSGLLKAEKLKTADAVEEKLQISRAIEAEKQTTEDQIKELENLLEAHRDQLSSLKEQVDSRPRLNLNTESLNSLSEKLQLKQRLIEGLLSEKSALALQLESEVNLNRKKRSFI